MPGTAGFIPVLHAATDSRPDEIDTVVAANSVAEALTRLGYLSEVIALTPDLGGIESLVARRPLLVFNLTDAVGGDCRLAPMVPARLDALKLSYTGAGTRAWLATLSKVDTKLKLAQAGLPTPDWSDDGSGFASEARVIVKPIWEHGSLGIDSTSVVPGPDAARAVAERTRRWNTEHFAELYVEGREFAAAMLEGPQGIEVLPLRETVFLGFGAEQPRIADYDSKWTPGSQPYEGTPRRFGIEQKEPVLARKLTRLALACWDLFELDGYARVDFRVDREGNPFILEVNMNPCLGTDAGFAASAAAAGLAYEGLILRIVEASLGRLQAIA